MFYVYILYSKSLDKYYIGYTSNIEQRLLEHLKGKHTSKFTRKNASDWVIVFTEEFESKTDAIKRELEIKSKKSRKYIQTLLNNS